VPETVYDAIYLLHVIAANQYRSNHNDGLIVSGVIFRQHVPGCIVCRNPRDAGRDQTVACRHSWYLWL